MDAQLANSDPATTPRRDSGVRLVETDARDSEGNPREGWRPATGDLIAAAALILSLVTSGMAILQGSAQDLIAKKDALHAAVHQYASDLSHNQEINKQWNLEMEDLGFNFQKTEKEQDPAFLKAENPKFKRVRDALVNFNENFKFETVALSKQAHSLIDDLGPAASAVDLTDVAVLLGNVDVQDFPEQLYTKAMQKAETSVEYLGAARGLAKALFKDGRIEDSKTVLIASRHVFDKFPAENQNNDKLLLVNLQTDIWAIKYVGTDDCALTQDYLSEVQNELPNLKKFPGAYSNIAYELNESTVTLRDCPAPTASPTVPAKNGPE